MYLTVKEIAEYLSLEEAYIESLILQKRIRAVHDGEQYLINKDQFNTHLEQVENHKRFVEEFLSESIPDDWDAKDED